MVAVVVSILSIVNNTYYFDMPHRYIIFPSVSLFTVLKILNDLKFDLILFASKIPSQFTLKL